MKLISSYSLSTFIPAMLVAVFALVSCTAMWTIGFQSDKNYSGDQMKGWVIVPDIYSAKNTIGEKELMTFLNNYSTNLKFILPNKRKIQSFYDIDVDSIKITLKNYKDTVFVKSNSFYYSNKSHKEMTKAIYFAPKDFSDKNKHYSVYVPDEVDSLILQFSVILRNAEYISYIEKPFTGVEVSFEVDSLVTIENAQQIIVPVELRLHKYVSKM